MRNHLFFIWFGFNNSISMPKGNFILEVINQQSTLIIKSEWPLFVNDRFLNKLTFPLSLLQLLINLLANDGEHKPNLISIKDRSTFIFKLLVL